VRLLADKQVRERYSEFKMGIKSAPQKEESTEPKSRALFRYCLIPAGNPAEKEPYCNGGLAIVGAVPSVV